MGKGSQALIGDMGRKLKLQVLTDSSASKGMTARRGHGNVRHIEVCQLWVQQEVHRNKITIVKVKGDNNISDILTKHVKRETLHKHVKHMKMERRKDRHEMNPTMAQDE